MMPDRPLLPAALAAVVVARLALAAAPLRTLLGLLDRLPAGGGAVPAEALGRSVALAGRLIPGTTCLAQALAARALLRWHGHDGALRIGVARDAAGRLIAHAWLEREGQVLVGGAAGHVARYTPLDAKGGPGHG